MAKKITVQEDIALVQAMQLKATGATVHKVNNLLCTYKGFIACYNDMGKHFEKIEEMERKMRVFLLEQNRLTFSGGSV